MSSPEFLFNGRFRILDEVGHGSYGTVYCCEVVESNNRIVAIKVLHSGGDAIIDSFLNHELAVSRVIRHPNIVRVYEMLSDGKLRGLCMEYIGGGSISTAIAEPKYLAIKWVKNALYQIADALDQLHRKGIIHCDINPDNILLTSDGVPKISDFGTAVSTNSGFIGPAPKRKGAVDYASPEYMEGQQIGPDVDMYAVGVLGFKMLTGVLPFEGETLCQRIDSKMHKDVPNPSDFRPNIPDRFAALIQTMIGKDKARRISNAAAFKRALSALPDTEKTTQISEETVEHESVLKHTLSLLRARLGI